MPDPKHHPLHSSLCRKQSTDSTAWAVFQSGTARVNLEQGLTVVIKPVSDHCSSLPHAWTAVSHQLRGAMGTGLSQAVLLWHWHKHLHDILASKGWKSPARDNNAWYSNFLSCSSCLQIKYASKPPVYTNWFPRGAVFVWVCQIRAITNCRGA